MIKGHSSKYFYQSVIRKKLQLNGITETIVENQVMI